MANIKKFVSSHDLEKKVMEYFESLGVLPTWQSLLFHLGISKQVVYEWQKNLPQYYKVMAEAKERIIAMLTEIIVNQSYHPAIRKMEGKKGKPRFLNVQYIAWYLKNLDHEQFSDQPDRVKELREQSTITLSLENKSDNKINFEEK